MRNFMKFVLSVLIRFGLVIKGHSDTVKYFLSY